MCVCSIYDIYYSSDVMKFGVEASHIIETSVRNT